MSDGAEEADENRFALLREVRSFIKENLKVVVDRSSKVMYKSAEIKVKLVLDDEVISEDSVSVFDEE